MFGILRHKLSKAFCVAAIAIALLSTVSCNRSNATLLAPTTNNTIQTGDIAEVSPPETIQTLRRDLDFYQPQVTIVSPEMDEVFQDDKVEVRLQVRDLPIFKNPELELGPHLHVIVDNQPYIAIYDLTKALTLPDLEPGTHTLRVFAARPWHESFKNAGAYAQTTFHIFTKTEDNNPDPALPLLTYSRPKGSYAAEPILLDFYLTNAPLRLAIAETAQNKFADWRIRCTVNGHSFVLDSWQSVYLKGFKPGKNWVQLEFIDSQGNAVKNFFNSTVRIITYEPKNKDTLSKLVTGELSRDAAQGIVDQNYSNLPTTTPEPLPVPTEVPELPIPTDTPTNLEPLPIPTETPSLEPLPVPSQTPTNLAPLPTPTETPTPEPSTDEVTSLKRRLGSYFNRSSRRPETNATPYQNLLKSQ